MDNDSGASREAKNNIFDNLTEIEKDLRLIDAEIQTHINNAESRISSKSAELQDLRDGKSNSIQKMKEYIDRNKSSSTRQIDKLDEKSRAYLTTTFYSVSLITMSFFIYKQLKQ